MSRAALRARGKRERQRLSEAKVRRIFDLYTGGTSTATIAQVTCTPERLVCAILTTMAQYLEAHTDVCTNEQGGGGGD